VSPGELRVTQHEVVLVDPANPDFTHDREVEVLNPALVAIPKPRWPLLLHRAPPWTPTIPNRRLGTELFGRVVLHEGLPSRLVVASLG